MLHCKNTTKINELNTFFENNTTSARLIHKAENESKGLRCLIADDAVPFRNTQADSIQLTLSEQIWLILYKIVAELAEFFEKEDEFIIHEILSDNEQFTKYLNFKPLMQAG